MIDLINRLKEMDGTQLNAFCEQVVKAGMGSKIVELIKLIELEQRTPVPKDYKESIRSMTDLNWDGEDV